MGSIWRRAPVAPRNDLALPAGRRAPVVALLLLLGARLLAPARTARVLLAVPPLFLPVSAVSWTPAPPPPPVVLVSALAPLSVLLPLRLCLPSPCLGRRLRGRRRVRLHGHRGERRGRVAGQRVVADCLQSVPGRLGLGTDRAVRTHAGQSTPAGRRSVFAGSGFVRHDGQPAIVVCC